MKKVLKPKSLVSYFSIISVLGVIIFTPYFMVWRSEIDKAYEWPVEVAKGAQKGLTAGISPNGVIGIVTGVDPYTANIWQITMPLGNPDDVIYITETSKEYETSSNNLDYRKLRLPLNFIKDTSETGQGQTKVRLPNGNRYALHAFPYSYGDVTGVAMVGRLNKPDQQKLDQFRNISIVAWALVSFIIYRVIKPLH